jgi:hypothetical protein
MSSTPGPAKWTSSLLLAELEFEPHVPDRLLLPPIVRHSAF